jgi:hypothetical protein
VGQVRDVLDAVVGLWGGGPARHPFAVLGLARVDALQDAQPAKVLEADLQLADRLVARDELRRLARLPLCALRSTKMNKSQ